MKKIILVTTLLGIGYLSALVPPSTFIDSTTGLEWQDNYEDTATGNIKTSSWSEAIDYCEGLDLANNSDWRLPNINELESIVERSEFNPSIKLGFNVTASDYYFSSTNFINGQHGGGATNGGEDANDHKSIWVIDFTNGKVVGDHKSNTHKVRCVRGN